MIHQVKYYNIASHKQATITKCSSKVGDYRISAHGHLNTTHDWPAWVLTWDINIIAYIYYYGSSYIDPLKCGTWVLTQEWALAWDTTVMSAVVS